MNTIISTADFMKDLNDLSPMVKVLEDATASVLGVGLINSPMLIT